jgi:aspartate kinase
MEVPKKGAAVTIIDDLCAPVGKERRKKMRVYKFGGASVRDAERIRDLEGILASRPEGPLMVVVSAMGKTTNALEEVAAAFFAGRREEALERFGRIRDAHLQTAAALSPEMGASAGGLLEPFCTEAEWLLHDRPVRGYDYYYDQIVCIGELLSTTLVAAWLNEKGFRVAWLDVRDVMRTDDDFREAGIDWEVTRANTERLVGPLFENHDIVLTQGFIGATADNESTTLGREGSDYTAAVFANLLKADSLTIWKDVPGILSADPKVIPSTVLIPELDYDEVIEMSYCGAQVIHPKTIKPLQNASIPLHVRSFTDPSAPGTVIHNRMTGRMPPIVVKKSNQVLLRLHSKDFSFVGERPVGELYALLDRLRLKPNLIQTGAVTVLVVLDDRPEKVDRLCRECATLFDTELQRGLSLVTIRHYDEASISAHASHVRFLIRQQTPETLQVLVEGE